MSYEFVNVDKSNTAGAGASIAKDPNVTIMRRADILTWPIRNSKGVLAVGDFVMKTGKRAIAIYMTGVNQQPTYETEGEVDMEQIMQKFVATHPGDTLEAHEFFQNNLGEDLVIVYGSCADDTKRIYGTSCSPMRLKNSFKADKDGTGHTFSFEQIQGTRFVPAHYNGNIPSALPFATDVSVDLAAASGYQYLIEALAVTAAITFPTSDLVSGDVVTLIGSGGADPATLVSGDNTAVNVILKDDTAWTALEDATISFEVFDAGATIYLIEKSRS